ncbi:MAG: hypothetical protein K1X66_06655 [Verrucomicrobiae bacterium]|nr:hypothetical protein [Verrucomicrobiae bacterium]
MKLIFWLFFLFHYLCVSATNEFYTIETPSKKFEVQLITYSPPLLTEKGEIKGQTPEWYGTFLKTDIRRSASYKDYLSSLSQERINFLKITKEKYEKGKKYALEKKSRFTENQSIFYEVRFREKNDITSFVASLDEKLVEQMPTNSIQLNYSIYVKRNGQWLAHFVPLKHDFWKFPISDLERLKKIIKTGKAKVAFDGKFQAVDSL